MRWMFTAGAGGAKLVCADVTLDFNDGLARAKPIVIETDNVQVVGGGSIDLPADSIALRFNTRPKRHELVNVATPFSVVGKLSKPVVKIDAGVIVGRVLGESLTAPFNVLGLLLPRRAKEEHRVCVAEGSP